MPTILLIRHGQASFGAAEYDALSETGARQAEVLAAALRRRGVGADRVLSGSFRRQLGSAEAFAPGGSPRVDERWNEYDANDLLANHGGSEVRLDGAERGDAPLSSRDFQAILDPALAAWIAAAERSACAQSWPAFAAGANAALAELAAQLERGETALVFTSAGVIAAVAATLLGAPEESFVALGRVQVNTGVTKVVHGAGGTSLVSFNDHSHLEEADRSLITYR